jgi:hypothetical protein
MYEISKYNEIKFLFIFQSKFYECGEDYFRTMCRDHVSILANLKPRYGQSINYFYSSSKYHRITKSSSYLFCIKNLMNAAKIIFRLCAETMLAFRPTLNRTTARVLIIFCMSEISVYGENPFLFILKS